MKKIIVLFSTALFLLNGYSQEHVVHRCYFDEAIQHQEAQNPGYINAINEAFSVAKASASTNYSRSGEDVLYRIPVVVHVVYNNANQNLHDSIVLSQIDVLNRDYQHLNADSVDLRAVFYPYVGRANFEFYLADIDPNGNPTTGINRVQTNKTSFMGGGLFPNPDDIEAVKKTAEGGVDPWPVERYMNIWVCNLASNGQASVLGMATPPAGLPNWAGNETTGMIDGVVIHYQVFGSNQGPLDMGQGMVIDPKGRTTVHEVGHYLGLRHIWGDADFMGIFPSCNGDDGIDDTPNANTKSNFDCNKTKNTCEDNIDGVDLPDMVENYMDYSAEECQVAFTKGQVELMTGVLENQRWELVSWRAQIETVCNGETFVSGENTYDETGEYFENVPALNDQDSTIIIYLTVLPEMTTENEVVLCQGTTYTIENIDYVDDATHVQLLQSVEGCDSTVTTIISFVEFYEATNNVTLCYGESYSVEEYVYDETGTHIDYLISVGGCDSIVTTNLIVLDLFEATNNVTLCDGQSFSVGENTYTDEGSYEAILQSVEGCDSTVTTIIVIDNPILTVEVSQVGETLTASANMGVTYQWINCDNNNSNISGATSATFTASVSGNYALRVTSTECTGVSEMSECYAVEVSTGLAEQVVSALKIYPNPTENEVFIEGDLTIETVKLRDLNGRLIFDKTVNDYSTSLNLEGLSQGIYLVEVWNKNGNVEVSKIVKE